MDYLYDKVGTYDALRAVMEGRAGMEELVHIQTELADISAHMLQFLENHDEQRIASPQFAGSAERGKPGMLVASTLSAAPTLVYFGQELGEPALQDAGFGKASRTTIFDYWSLPSVRRWITGQSTEEEGELRDFYRRLLNFSAHNKALRGDYMELHSYNRERSDNYNDKLFSFARWADEERLLVVANFGREKSEPQLHIPAELLQQWKLQDGSYRLVDQLDSAMKVKLAVNGGDGKISLKLQPNASHVFRVEN
jgi:glycosidase